ncbi:hypothetical protein C8R45DRAFT_972472 [Mycena sanguinolenta]|nr:hypothetical protein C8R45DRAFT_972472 [Mycena sanguinolenta]
MSPIRVGLIGLSSSAKTSWASAAHLPYLLSPRGLERFKIVALCNSTIESANGAIDTFGLPPSTRAYGSPVDLAADAEVDLVVCCTRVDVHHSTIRPALAAGKMVYCEWPLAQDLPHVLDLTQLARDNDVRAMVGLQGRVAPVVQKLKALVNGGCIGKIVNVEVRATGGLNNRGELPKSLDYFMQRAVGGNVFTIGFGHLWDHIQYVHGDALNIQSRLQLQFPNNKMRNPSTGDIVESVTSDVPDIVVVTGRLAESSAVQRGATVHIRFRRGPPSFNDPALVWTVTGETGEIRLTNEEGTTLHAMHHVGVRIEVVDFEGAKTEGDAAFERAEWKWAPWQEELPMVARSVGALYEAFSDALADGNSSETRGYPTFEDAQKRHDQLEGMLSAWDADKKES